MMASEDGDVVVTSSYLFNLDDDDGYEDLLGTQIPNDNPDLPLLDLDEDFPAGSTEHPAQHGQQTTLPLPQTVQLPQQTEARRQLQWIKIPENVEIIDLDSPDTDGPRGISASQITQIPIKTEDQDVILLENNETAAIKEEQSETPFSWNAMPEKFINLIDSDEKPNGNNPNDPQTAVIKQEQEKEDWTWAAMQSGVIELSDSDDDNVVKSPPTVSTTEPKKHVVPSEEAEKPEQVEKVKKAQRLDQVLQQPEQSEQIAPSQATTGSTPNKPVSQVPNVKAKRTPADRAKLLQLQKLYAERALGKKVIVGAGNIFKGAQGPTGSIHAEVENDLAWMDNTADLNDDAEAATEFARVKAKYNRKKRAGRNTFEDDVLFMKADSAEKARLKRLDDDYARDRGPIYRYCLKDVSLIMLTVE